MEISLLLLFTLGVQCVIGRSSYRPIVIGEEEKEKVAGLAEGTEKKAAEFADATEKEAAEFAERVATEAAGIAEEKVEKRKFQRKFRCCAGGEIPRVEGYYFGSARMSCCSCGPLSPCLLNSG